MKCKEAPDLRKIARNLGRFRKTIPHYKPHKINHTECTKNQRTQYLQVLLAEQMFADHSADESEYKSAHSSETGDHKHDKHARINNASKSHTLRDEPRESDESGSDF